MQYINGDDNVLSLYPNPDDPGVILIGTASDPKNVITNFPTKLLGELLRGEETAVMTANSVYLTVSDDGEFFVVRCLGQDKVDAFPLSKLHIG